MKLLSFIILIPLLLGCASPVRDWTEQRNEARKQLIATTQRAGELEAKIALLPEGPERDKALATLTEVEDLGAVLAEKIDDLDGVIVATKAGSAANVSDSVGDLLAGTRFEKYAWILSALLPIAWAVLERLSRKRQVAGITDHLKNVVTSLEKAGPEWSEQDKVNVAAYQGLDTSRFVGALKKTLDL